MTVARKEVVFVLRACRAESEPVCYRRVEYSVTSMHTGEHEVYDDYACAWPPSRSQQPTEYISAIDAEPEARAYLRDLIATAADVGRNERSTQTAFHMALLNGF